MRNWRIVNIEDKPEAVGFLEELNEDYISAIKGRFNTLDFNAEISKVEAIPLFTLAWKYLHDNKAAELSPDIGYYDIKLNEWTTKDDMKSLEKIGDQICSKLPLKELYQESDGSYTVAVDTLFKDEQRIMNDLLPLAGFYLLVESRRLFPEMKIVLYSATHTAVAHSIPYQYAGYYTMLPNSKFLLVSQNKSISWLSMLRKALVAKLNRGEVSIIKVRKALNTYYQSISYLSNSNEITAANFSEEEYIKHTYEQLRRIYILLPAFENNEKAIANINKLCLSNKITITDLTTITGGSIAPIEKGTQAAYSLYKPNFKTLLESPIGGSSSKEWLFGSFFFFEFYNYASKGLANVDEFHHCLSDIEKLADSVDFAKQLGRFVRESNFDPMSHCKDSRPTMLVSLGEYKKPGNKLTPGELAVVLENMRHNWKHQPFYDHNSEWLQFMKSLLDIKEVSTACDEFCEAKIAMRFRGGKFVTEISSLGKVNCAPEFKANCAKVEAYSPYRVVNGQKESLLVALLKATLNVIKDSTKGNATEFGWNISFDDVTKQYVIELNQYDGNTFIDLDTLVFGNGDGDFDKILNASRGWVQIAIKSANILRNPFSKESSKFTMPGGVAVQYEFRISAYNGSWVN